MKVTLTTREMAICMMMGALRMWQVVPSWIRLLSTRIKRLHKDSWRNMHLVSNSICTWISLVILKKIRLTLSAEGNTIDVKATDNLDGNLVVPKLMHDVYVLAIVDGSTVDLVGYATKEMIEEAGKKDLGKVLFGSLTGKI
jgi:hypothetical protein